MPVTISFTINSARELKDLSPQSNLLVKLQFGHGGDKKITSTKPGPTPAWNQRFEMQCKSLDDATLKITLFEVETKNCIGIMKIPCGSGDVLKEKTWYPLHERISAKDAGATPKSGGSGGIKGHISIEIHSLTKADSVSPRLTVTQASPVNNNQAITPTSATTTPSLTTTFSFMQSVALCSRIFQEVVNTLLYCEPLWTVGVFLAVLSLWSTGSLMGYSLFGILVGNAVKVACVNHPASPTGGQQRYVYPISRSPFLHTLSKFNCLVGDRTKAKQCEVLFEEVITSLASVPWGYVPVGGVVLSVLAWLLSMQSVVNFVIFGCFVIFPVWYYITPDTSFSAILTEAQQRRPVLMDGSELKLALLSAAPPTIPPLQLTPDSGRGAIGVSPKPHYLSTQSRHERTTSDLDISGIHNFHSEGDTMIDSIIMQNLSPQPIHMRSNSSPRLQGLLPHVTSQADMRAMSRPTRAVCCVLLGFRTVAVKNEVLQSINAFAEKLRAAQTKIDDQNKQQLLTLSIECALSIEKNLHKAVRFVLVPSVIENGGLLVRDTFETMMLNLQGAVKVQDFIRKENCVTLPYLNFQEFQELEADCQKCAVMAQPVRKHTRDNTLCVAAVTLQLLQASVPAAYSSPSQNFIAFMMPIAPSTGTTLDVTLWPPVWTDRVPEFCPTKLHQALRGQWEAGEERTMTLNYFELLLRQFNQLSKKSNKVQIPPGGIDSPPQPQPVNSTLKRTNSGTAGGRRRRQSQVAEKVGDTLKTRSDVF
eukprot:PhF_6_TR26201/c0_g1_i1/m.37309